MMSRLGPRATPASDLQSVSQRGNAQEDPSVGADQAGKFASERLVIKALWLRVSPIEEIHIVREDQVAVGHVFPVDGAGAKVGAQASGLIRVELQRMH